MWIITLLVAVFIVIFIAFIVPMIYRWYVQGSLRTAPCEENTEHCWKTSEVFEPDDDDSDEGSDVPVC